MSNIEKRNLPTLEELYGDKAMAVKHSQFNVLMNQQPKKEWLKDHPLFKDVKTLPIERVEWLLTRIFTRWWVDVKNIQVIANSVVVTVRLYAIDPVSSDTIWQDGLSAWPIQTAKSAGAMDWNQVNTYSVQQATPAAESLAIKDAAEKWGKIFGKDINRNQDLSYEMIADKLSIQQLRERISKKLSENQDNEEREFIAEMIVNKEESGEATIDFYNKILEQIGGTDGI